MPKKISRFWEIDALRGFAIILMVIFNYAFTLRYLGVYAIGGGDLFWGLFPRLIAGIFIFLVGISLSISYSRRKKEDFKRHYILRGAKIFSWGLIITAVTYIFMPQATIYFGVLHLIGLSIILAISFLRSDPKYTIILSVIFIIVGNYLNTLTTETPYLLWLGLMPSNFYTFDYFPLLPWFGLVLLGLYTGKILYPNAKRIFRIREIKPGLLCFLGRHSLLIYLIHQPVLIAVLYLLGYTVL